jgi:hypothetical protein
MCWFGRHAMCLLAERQESALHWRCAQISVLFSTCECSAHVYLNVPSRRHANARTHARTHARVCNADAQTVPSWTSLLDVWCSKFRYKITKTRAHARVNVAGWDRCLLSVRVCTHNARVSAETKTSTHTAGGQLRKNSGEFQRQPAEKLAESLIMSA